MPAHKRDPKSETKICIVCKATICRYPGISDKVWEMKKTCSRVCGYVSRHKSTKPRNLRRRKDLTQTPYYRNGES